jgi:hypothetical protein
MVGYCNLKLSEPLHVCVKILPGRISKIEQPGMRREARAKAFDYVFLDRIVFARRQVQRRAIRQLRGVRFLKNSRTAISHLGDPNCRIAASASSEMA